MTGAKYGIYDLEWIIKSLEIDEANDRLYVSARGIYAVEDYLAGALLYVPAGLFSPHAAFGGKRFAVAVQTRFENFSGREICLVCRKNGV